jgi:hypothetical protein
MQKTTLQEASDPTTPPSRLLALVKEDPSLLGTIAQNPAAPPEWLEATSKNKEQEIRRCVASNPNTPTSVLLVIGGEFPKELLANPAFSLFFLENPNLLYQVTDYLLSHIARFPEVPEILLQRASRGPDHVRRAAAKNPSLPEEMLFRLGGDELPDVRHEILRRSWSSPSRQLLRRLGIIADHHTLPPTDKTLTAEELGLLCESGGFAQWLVTKHPNVTSEQLEMLSNKTSTLVLSGVARCPKTPEAVIKKLTSRYELAIKTALLENPNLSAESVQAFAARPNIEHALKIALSHRPELTQKQLEIFSKSGRVAIRTGIAKNPSTSSRILAALSHDKSVGVRGAVAQHPSLDPKNFELLAKDPIAAVRSVLTTRPDLPAVFIELLSKDISPRVQSYIAKRKDTAPEILSRLILSPYREVFQAALQNEATPKEVKDLVMRVKEKCPLTQAEVEAFYQQGDHAKILLAGHPQVPQHYLQEMLDTKNPLLCLAVAQSPNAKYPMLRWLLDDPNVEVSVMAAKRISSSETPQEDPTLLATMKALPDWLQKRLQRSQQRQLDQKAARDPGTPPDAIEALAKKNEKELMRILASRKDLPLQALQWFKGRFTRKLLENPDFSARLVQNPEEFQRLPGNILQGALSQPEIPEAFLLWGIGHPSMEVRQAVSRNPKASSSTLAQLAQTKDLSFTLRRLIAQHPNTPEELLATFSQSHDPWLKIWAERALQQR